MLGSYKIFLTKTNPTTFLWLFSTFCIFPNSLTYTGSPKSDNPDHKTAAKLTENERHFWGWFLANVWPLGRQQWRLITVRKKRRALRLFVAWPNIASTVSQCKSKLNSHVFCSNASFNSTARQQWRWLADHWNVCSEILRSIRSCVLQTPNNLSRIYTNTGKILSRYYATNKHKFNGKFYRLLNKI